MYSIVEIHPDKHQLGDPFWDKYYEFVKQSSLERRPDEPVVSLEQIVKRQHEQKKIPHFNVYLHMVELDGKYVAWSGFGVTLPTSSDFKENGHSLSGSIMVLEKYQRRGIGTALLKNMIEIAKQFDYIKVISGSTDKESGKKFLQKIGAKTVLEGAENRLYLKDVDWDLMKNWREMGKTKTPDTTLEFYEEIPEDMLPEYLDILVESLNEAPQGDISTKAVISIEDYKEGRKRMSKLGNKQMTYLSREKNGELSGITEIYINKEQEFKIDQGITGVRPNYRGKRLGKRLKAEMMFYIKDTIKDVKYITTGNATTNKPMLDINYEMGFKMHEHNVIVELDINSLNV